MTSKSILRKELKSLRDSMSQEERVTKSRHIFENLHSLSQFRNATVVAFYLSFGSEVITDLMIDWCLGHRKTVVVPKMDEDTLKLVRFEGFDKLKKGAFGVREPAPSEFFAGKPDVIIVPGLAFDKSGHRLGYGKGHYDRFLKTQPSLKIGICFELQIIDKIPSESHDVKLDYAITEKNSFCFGGK